MPEWVKARIDEWILASGTASGRLFRSINKNGVVWGELRRTCARLCHVSGGELEQIQFLLGHVSVQTTERYLGCKQKIRDAVNDRIGIEPPE